MDRRVSALQRRRSRCRCLLGLALGLAAGTAAIGGCERSAPTSSTPAPVATIPAHLLREARPIGVGRRFHPPSRGPVPGPCRDRLGARRGVHVELFAADRVVVIAAGIGVRAPGARNAGRISAARCYGTLVTLEPTGVVLVRRGARPTLGDLFRAWGQPLSDRRAGPFAAPPADPVRVYVRGHRVRIRPDAVRLRPHGEIVVEVGPRIPPHAGYTFPPGT